MSMYHNVTGYTSNSAKAAEGFFLNLLLQIALGSFTSAARKKHNPSAQILRDMNEIPVTLNKICKNLKECHASLQKHIFKNHFYRFCSHCANVYECAYFYKNNGNQITKKTKTKANKSIYASTMKTEYQHHRLPISQTASNQLKHPPKKKHLIFSLARLSTLITGS